MRIPDNPTESLSVDVIDAQAETDIDTVLESEDELQSTGDWRATVPAAAHGSEITACADVEQNANASDTRIVRRPRRFGSFH